MDEIPKKGPDPGSSPPDSSKWIYRIVIAVVLGEAIWNVLASLANDLLLPTIGKVVGGVQFDFKVSNFFASIIGLCLAGTVAVVLNSWSRKILKADLKPANRESVVAQAPVRVPATAAPTVLPSAAPTSSIMATPATSAAAGSTALKAQAPAPSPVPPPAKPPKPAREKQIYYNIVGEPVDADDE